MILKQFERQKEDINKLKATLKQDIKRIQDFLTAPKEIQTRADLVNTFQKEKETIQGQID